MAGTNGSGDILRLWAMRTAMGAPNGGADGGGALLETKLVGMAMSNLSKPRIHAGGNPRVSVRRP